MPILLRRVLFPASETLMPILRDADEDDQRIRSTLANEAYTTYAALDNEQLVGQRRCIGRIMKARLNILRLLQRYEDRGMEKR